MTVLEAFQKLECSGLWRESPDHQRREVHVALGEASLVITDRASRVLSHWSLPAVQRLNPGNLPARYAPGRDSLEDLEIDDPTMIEGIEVIRKALSKSQTHPGRLRVALIASILAMVLLLLLFWAPSALVKYTVSVVPDAKRTEIGNRVLRVVEDLAGGSCESVDTPLTSLSARLGFHADTRISILQSGSRTTAHFPGRVFALNRILVEDFETAEVLAGYLLAEQQRAALVDPLNAMLEIVGTWSTLGLLTTGELSDAAVRAYAEAIVTGEPEPIDDAILLSQFASAQVAATPYARALDVTGEATQTLIAGDPFGGGGAPPVLSDAEWVALQGICGN